MNPFMKLPWNGPVEKEGVSKLRLGKVIDCNCNKEYSIAMAHKQMWLWPQKAPCMCGQEPVC